MIKLFRKIHLWLSVPFGVIITLVCFSGAMLIFEPEITRAVRSDVYYVGEVKDQPLSIGELMETVKASLPDSVSVNGVTICSDETRTYQVSLSKPRRASLFIDQYSGKITGRYERIGFFSTMFKLHRWLLDGANPHGDGLKVGKLLVGVSTLMFVIALITGVIIWWPRARRNFRRSMSISFKDGWRGLWKSLHVAGGMYALVFVLAMALTGLTWSFDWYRTAFYAVCGVEHTPRNFGGSTNEKSVERGHGDESRGNH
ncbi:MAG: PepSY domain-containing protein, partial [Muribaculaceae bacterium]|nr:PepSY domain-containing protein [Muribaculaceae bacterium]